MAREIEYVSKDVLIEWFRPYLHTEEPIPADVLISDIRMMSPTLTPPNEWVSVDERLPDKHYAEPLEIYSRLSAAGIGYRSFVAEWMGNEG